MDGNVKMNFDPMTGEPLNPVAEEPAIAEPVVAEPVAAEPVAAEPVATEPVASEPVAAEPAPAAAPIDHAAAQEALFSIFGDMLTEPTPPPVAAAPEPVEEPATSIPVFHHPPVEEISLDGESDMPVAPRPVTETRYERPDSQRTVESVPYIRPMPNIAEGETIVPAERTFERPSVSLDGTHVVPLPEMPDIQIQRKEGVPIGAVTDTSAVDAAWEQLMNGVTNNPQ